mgnify:CR=1 FL=1
MFEERKISPELRKQYREKGYWKDETLLDCWDRTVEKYPDREYVVDDRGNRYTYRQMDEAASKVAAVSPEAGGFAGRRGIVPASRSGASSWW